MPIGYLRFTVARAFGTSVALASIALPLIGRNQYDKDSEVRHLHSLPNQYSITIILLSGEKRVIEFQRHAYNNLMELIVNELYEDIGDCKGHAWCGTCHVEIVSGEINEEMNRDESMTLGNLPNTVPSSRLACQIMTDELINSMVFRVLGDV